MNEFIEVRFRKNGRRLRVRRQLTGGIEFDEPDPLERTVGLEFSARSEATRVRMQSIGRIQGWEPGQFKLNMSVEDGSILLRGVNPHALPEGLYRIRLQIEEAKTPKAYTADVDHDGSATIDVDVELDARDVAVDLTGADQRVARVASRRWGPQGVSTTT